MIKSLASIILLTLLAACAPAAQNTPVTISPVEQDEATPTAPIRSAQATPTPETASAAEGQAAAYTAQPWASLPLTNASSGQTFTFADFAGKTIFVEPMATWCTNCRAQLPNAEAARARLDPNQFVFVGLSVAENVDNGTLAQYAADNGWNFTFAVASAEVTQGLIDTFDRTVITPPATPHFIIRPDGSVTEVFTGSHSADDLIAQLTAASGA